MIRILCLTALVSVAACGLVLGPDESRVLGTIGFYGDPVRVEVPESVRAGEPFTATVITYGGGCDEMGTTDVDVRGLRAEIAPYDIEIEANVCTAILKLFEHSATVSFQRAGTATVVFRGVIEPDNEVITVERSVTVLPANA